MRQLNQYLTKFLSFNVLLILVVLSGCSQSNLKFTAEPATLPYKVAGARDRTMVNLTTRLKKSKIQVITIGQDYMVSVPSQLLFPNESPQLSWKSYKYLNIIVCYLSQFYKIAINITAFSECGASTRRAHALTLARANAIANYLWSQGVDSRFIFTQGLGHDKPICDFVTKTGDNSPNSRIEITFRDAVA